MRVNVDSELFGDERLLRLADELKIPVPHAIGCLVLVWHQCYTMRSGSISALIVDAHAQMSGFADAMVTSGLAIGLPVANPMGLPIANPIRVGYIKVKGVDERVEFLRKQSELGKKGNAARWGSNAQPESGSRQATRIAIAGRPSLSLSQKTPESGARVRAHGSIDPIPEPDQDPDAWRKDLAAGSTSPVADAPPYEPPAPTVRPYTPRNGSYGAPRAAQAPIQGSERTVRVCPGCNRPAGPPSVERDGKLYHYTCLYAPLEEKS